MRWSSTGGVQAVKIENPSEIFVLLRWYFDEVREDIHAAILVS
jgi:hypothetical protein